MGFIPSVPRARENVCWQRLALTPSLKGLNFGELLGEEY